MICDIIKTHIIIVVAHGRHTLQARGAHYLNKY